VTTTTIKELHPHIGSVWARAVSLWSTWVADSTLTFAQTTGGDGSRRYVQITTSDGTDTTVWKLVDDGTQASAQVPVPWVAGRPGWQTMPTMQLPTQAGRTTLTEWRNKMAPLRNEIWENWCGAVLGDAVQQSNYLSYEDFQSDIDYFTVRFNPFIILDALSLITGTPTATTYYYNGTPHSYPLATEVPTIYSAGGGGSVDLDPLVEAVQDLSFVDYTFSTNNGANMFSMRGKVRVS